MSIISVADRIMSSEAWGELAVQLDAASAAEPDAEVRADLRAMCLAALAAKDQAWIVEQS